jgi:hypothetical protein
MLFMETSCENGSNVQAAFTSVVTAACPVLHTLTIPQKPDIKAKTSLLVSDFVAPRPAITVITQEKDEEVNKEQATCCTLM